MSAVRSWLLAAALLGLGACNPAQPPAKPSASSAPATGAAPVDETTPTAAGAQAFLEAVYKGYDDPEPNTFGPDRAKVYDAAMLALMALDECISNGDIGVLDYDPLCECQDPDGLDRMIVITTATADAASAKVKVFSRPEPGKPADSPPKFEDAIALNLVFEAGHWRVHDVTHDGSSLRKMFETSNAKPSPRSKICAAKLPK